MDWRKPVQRGINKYNTIFLLCVLSQLVHSILFNLFYYIELQLSVLYFIFKIKDKKYTINCTKEKKNFIKIIFFVHMKMILLFNMLNN